MAFVNRLLKLPAADDPNFRATLLRYFSDLQKPGALAIQRMQYWTPTLTFATPGNLSVVYSTRVGEVIQTENEIRALFRIVTSTFTHTTAAGDLQVTGLPYLANADTGYTRDGNCVWSGITKAGYTQISCSVSAGSGTILFSASGSGVAVTTVGAGDMPTTGTVVLRGNISLRI